LLIGIKSTLEILHKYVPREKIHNCWQRDNKENQGGSNYLMTGFGINNYATGGLFV